MISLEQLVHEHLDNAKDNGYAEFLVGTPQAVAEDMIELSTDFDEYYAPSDLIPYIQTWHNKQGIR